MRARLAPLLQRLLACSCWLHAVWSQLHVHTQLRDPAGSRALSCDIQCWGDNALRVRVGYSDLDVKVGALLPDPPPSSDCASAAEGRIRSSNLEALITPEGGIRFVRVSENRTLLSTTNLRFEHGPSPPSATAEFSFSPGETLYGFGEHRSGAVGYTEFYRRFEQSQNYSASKGADVSIPFYSSTGGYAFLWNVPAFGSVNASSAGGRIAWRAASTPAIDFWVAAVPSDWPPRRPPFAPLMRSYVDATGHPPRIPTYATGFIQSKNRYRNQTQLVAVAEEYRRRGLPISMIVADYHHWPAFGEWRFTPECWPDPGAMVRAVEGARVMVSVWPLVSPNSSHAAAMLDGGMLVRDASGRAKAFHNDCYVYDPYSAKAREFLWQRLLEGYVRHGIADFWLDADEPEGQSIQGNRPGDWFYALGRDLEVGMAYPLLHQRGIWKGLARLGPQGSGQDGSLLLSRSAWAGSQRYGAAVWSGDIASTFAELATQVKVAQGMAMSGIYWWTTDIGGYRDGDVRNETFRELVVRWFQFGAFCPLFRLHGERKPAEHPGEVPVPGQYTCGPFMGGDNEVWSFGPRALEIIRGLMALREALRGYVRDGLDTAARMGEPLLRPMAYDFEDAEAAGAEDQFMFGWAWLVAPVTESGATERSVFLPRLPGGGATPSDGENWVYYFTGKRYRSGQAVSVKTSLEDFPLFYRSSYSPPRLSTAGAAGVEDYADQALASGTRTTA